MVFFFFFNSVVAQPEPSPPGQPWPKLMQLYDGRIVQVQYDSIGQALYLNWQNRRIPEMVTPYDHTKAKYLYIDSTGKPLSNKRYDYATPFYDNFAVVGIRDAEEQATGNYRPKEKWMSAVINPKEEEVVPMSEYGKQLPSHGLIIASYDRNHKVYTTTGKKLAECTSCDVGFGTGLNSFWLSPATYWRSRDEKVVTLMDLNGNLLYKGRGVHMEQICHSHTTYKSPVCSWQPYYHVLREEMDGMSIILDPNGKVVMDSMSFSYMTGGQYRVFKNGLVAIMDTTWKEVFPFSNGYSHLNEIHYGHPQQALVANKKNEKSIVIDKNNKRLVPMESWSVISYDPLQRLYKTNDREGNYWYMSLEGDTVANPLKYYDVHQQYPQLPGFFVKCRPGNLTGYLDEKGKLLVPCQYEQLYYGGKNLLLFFSDGGAGYLDMHGKVKFRVGNVFKMSTFSNGYALCGYKVTDPKKFIAGVTAETDFHQVRYQMHHRLIDSLGRFVSPETFVYINRFEGGCALVFRNGRWQYVDKRLKEIVLPDGSRLCSNFYKGTAMVRNVKKNTVGVVNEKLEVIVPVIYDVIDTRLQEDLNYAYDMASKMATEYGWNMHTGYYANIVDGKLKVTLKGVEKVVIVGK